LAEPLLNKGGARGRQGRGGAGGGCLAEGTVATSVVLLTSAAVGTGVLALPYAVSCVGVLPAMFVFAMAGAAAYASNMILFQCVQETGKGSYGELMNGILGKSGAMVLDCFVVLEGFGAVATYLVFIMDYVPQVCAIGGEDLWCTDRINVVVVVMLCIWPLSCLRGLTPLRYISTCSIVTILFTSLVVVLKAPGCFVRTGQALRPSLAEVHMNRDALQVLAIVCFAFMNHTNTPEVALRLQVPYQRRASQVVGTHTVLLCAVYLAIAVCGYLSFLDDIHQDFLTNYDLRDLLVVACRTFLSVTLVFACPINIFPAMQALFNILEAVRRAPKGTRSLYDTTVVRVPVTTICLAAALGVALRTPRVADLISLVCSFFTCPLMFAFPAFMSWRILGRREIGVPSLLLALTGVLWINELSRLCL